MPRRRGERGAGVVYTEDWVVDLILDLVGYVADADLGADTVVEPGCGDGAFLRRIVPRLLTSARKHGRDPSSLTKAIRAYELDASAAALARGAAKEALVAGDVSLEAANALADAWVIEEDFLIDTTGPSVNWVVGNPPYVRVEETSPNSYEKYRSRWTTMTGRADVYIGFYEAGLSLLKNGGQLCFICADRWMHNQYGARLRKHIIDNFAVRSIIELHESNVFDVQVAAYPAITQIKKSSHTATALATANASFDRSSARRLVGWLQSGEESDLTDNAFTASVLTGQYKSDDSWPSGPPERLRLVADLETRFPSLSEVGITVGVGMATGADNVYIVNDPGDIEANFLKPAIGPADLKDGAIEWRGRHLISPWEGTQLADIERYPQLRRHLEKYRQKLESRYVARRNPDRWWRTIDRPPADQYAQAKLIVADINDRIDPVLDRDGRWPLHSAYYVVSSEWEIEALGGYLLSDLAGAFVQAYSVKMANGHLRVSGQYLKKIRIPHAADVPTETHAELRRAFRARDRAAATALVEKLLRSSPSSGTIAGRSDG